MVEELANGNAAFVDVQVKELDDNQLKDLGHFSVKNDRTLIYNGKETDFFWSGKL